MTQELLTVADVKFKFVNVTENMEADIKKAVEHQLANKGQTILKKIYANNVDAKVIVEYTIERNKNWLYEADFIFNFGGEKFVVEGIQDRNWSRSSCIWQAKEKSAWILGGFVF